MWQSGLSSQSSVLEEVVRSSSRQVARHLVAVTHSLSPRARALVSDNTITITGINVSMVVDRCVSQAGHSENDPLGVWELYINPYLVCGFTHSFDYQ